MARRGGFPMGGMGGGAMNNLMKQAMATARKLEKAKQELEGKLLRHQAAVVR